MRLSHCWDEEVRAVQARLSGDAGVLSCDRSKVKDEYFREIEIRNIRSIRMSM